MILKRLIEILKSFDKVDLKKFGRFIRSDYFNTNDRVSALLKAIKKFYPLFNDTKMTKQYLFNQIYDTKNYNDKTFRYILDELFKLAEKFIAISFFADEPVQLRKKFIDGLIKRKIFSQAYNLLKASEDDLEENFVISEDYISLKIDYSQLWHRLFFLSNRRDPLLNKRIEQGEYSTLINIMELCHLYQNLNAIKSSYNIEPEDNIMLALVNNLNYKGLLGYLDKLEETYKENKNRSNLANALKIYLCFMITFLDVKDEEYFYKLKDYINRYDKYFDNTEQQNLHVMLRNCCWVKSKAINYDKYLKYYFEAAKIALRKNLFTAYTGQYMEVSSFLRIFQTALYFKDYTWAESFKNKYVKQLSPEFRNDLLYYTDAEICFRKKQFEESLKLLTMLNNNLVQLKLNVRTLRFMIYYEMSYIEETFAMADSFTHFLTYNKKVITELRTSAMNFISYATRLIRLKENPGNKRNMMLLKNDIMKCVTLDKKDWLLEKIYELK